MIASGDVCVSVRMGFASSTACMIDALSVGLRSDPPETNNDLCVTDISQLPMVAGRRGTSFGHDCWITRKRPRSCLSSRSLMTVSPTLTSVFAIQVLKVLSFIFFIVLHTDMDASGTRRSLTNFR